MASSADLDLQCFQIRGPWVTHLRVTVYKGIGKQSSSQSPAMNLDRSTFS